MFPPLPPVGEPPPLPPVPGPVPGSVGSFAQPAASASAPSSENSKAVTEAENEGAENEEKGRRMGRLKVPGRPRGALVGFAQTVRPGCRREAYTVTRNSG